jgi:hypothetical protein
MESPTFRAAPAVLSQSQDQFDQRFKQRVADTTVLNLNTPPSDPLPELFSSQTS